MINNKEIIEKKISEKLQTTLTIQNKHYVGGGCINQTSVITLDNGKKYFLKENNNHHENLFAAETAGLIALSRNEGPTIPQPITFCEDEGAKFLVMEYISSAQRSDKFWENFGKNLARLHKTNTSTNFGFESNNHIGATPQLNTQEQSWLDFFAKHRLDYQLRLAQKRNLVNNDLADDINKLIENIGKYICETETPALLHGDLWNGNFIIGNDGEAVLIDPAVYYGHPEADLAMTELFGGFHYTFYVAYREEYPLEPEYEKRKDFYNLYHMLNHLNLFGLSYLGSVKNIVTKYK